MNHPITHVGIDAHKKFHQVALVTGEGEFEEWTVRNTDREVRQMAKRIKKKASGSVVACYEAGACGFTLQRQLESEGIDCKVVAPSLIPVKAGKRIKTDSRDARELLQYLSAGLLTEVAVPSRQEENLRDLCRCRETIKKSLGAARQHLLKFLNRRGLTYSQGENWTLKHGRWLRGLSFEDRNEEKVFSYYLSEVEHLEDQLKDFNEELEKESQTEPCREIVGYLRCFRGIDTISAMTICTELFHPVRFQSPRSLMNYLGLIPSLYRSAETSREGGITKAGNKHVRRTLVESAWHYRHPPRLSQSLKSRRKNQPQWVTNLADRAMRRLHKRHKHLKKNGKKPTVATTAVARELAGFIWAVLHEHTRRGFEKRTLNSKRKPQTTA